jgi:hypothetical protein
MTGWRRQLQRRDEGGDGDGMEAAMGDRIAKGDDSDGMEAATAIVGWRRRWRRACRCSLLVVARKSPQFPSDS